MTVDVTNYGASPDDASDDTDAIRSAANAAAPSGTVFFPSGEYLVGSDTRLPLDYPEDGSWDDLTWEGEDWTQTVIKLAGGQTKFHCIWNITPTTAVTNLTIKQLTIDGNGRNQDYDIGVGIHAENITGTTKLVDCRMVDWATNGVGCDNGGLEIDHCEFERCGHAANRISGQAGHAFALHTDETAHVAWSLFEDTIGTDGDVSTDAGTTLTMTRCIGRGRTTYSALLKINPGSSDVTIQNCRVENRGTMAVKSNPESTNLGSITLDNVLVDGADWPALDFPAPGDLTVNNCAFKNVDRDDNRGVGIYTDDIDWNSSGQLSVHNVGSNNDGDAMSVSGGAGSISEIIYGGVSGVGSIDGTSVGTTTQGTALSPDTPAEADVGPRSPSSDSDSSDSDSSDSESSYGGYNQPELGTTDWHTPLNENFGDIEADVVDLAKRIEDLEQQVN